MFVQFRIGRHRCAWGVEDLKGMENVFIATICSVDVAFFLCVSTERWLKHLGDKQLWKRSMLGFPYGLYITPRKWQMMPLNFYSQCYTITYGVSSSCKETFVALLHLCTVTTHTNKNAGTILTLLIFWKTADNTHSHTQKQYVCTTNGQTATGYTMKKQRLVLKLFSLALLKALSQETEKLLILKCGISPAKAGVMVNSCPWFGKLKIMVPNRTEK